MGGQVVPLNQHTLMTEDLIASGGLVETIKQLINAGIKNGYSPTCPIGIGGWVQRLLIPVIGVSYQMHFMRPEFTSIPIIGVKMYDYLIGAQQESIY